MIGWTLHMLLATTLLMGAVLVLRVPVMRSFGPRAAYALWLLPALRMILPPLPGWDLLHVPLAALPSGPIGIDLAEPSGGIMAAPALAIAHGTAAVSMLTALVRLAGEVVVSIVPVLALLWLAGAVLWFGWQMRRYFLFLDEAVGSSRLLSRLGGVDFLMSDAVDGPMAAGILKRRIFLPADFMVRYAPEERRLALLHEAAHHDRMDIFANLAGLVLVALHWWNPLAHRAYRVFRTDQELACDATVLAKARAQERHDYGVAMLKSASARMPGFACALNHKAELKQRLRMMAAKPASLPRLVCGGIVVAAAVTIGLLATATGEGARAADTSASRMAEAIGLPASQDEADRRQEAEDRTREAEDREQEAADRQAEAVERQIEAVQRQAEAEVRQADAEARRADEQARRVEAAKRAAEALGRTQQVLESAKAELAAQCEASGTPQSADADWHVLATCGEQLRAMIKSSLDKAREAIRNLPSLNDTERTKALAAIDRAEARADRGLAKAARS
ncbi:MAG TPA: M56 family metallopeptidase [Aliidongia sp.]|nr:M56 family metallopeptidase [Aliidongia sp.]